MGDYAYRLECLLPSVVSFVNNAYSKPASKDSSVKRDADTLRLDWLEKERAKSDGGSIVFRRHGIEWTSLFTISSQQTENMPTIRQAIDEAMKIAETIKEPK
jgi:hypothetical protein